MKPASVVQSLLALSVRYRAAVFFCENRAMGQRVTESLLEKYAREMCGRFDVLQKAVEQGEAA